MILKVILILSVWLGAAEMRAKTDSVVTRKGGETLLENVYANIELRHHLNTYYDRDGFKNKQEPSFHMRAKIGSTFKNGLIDAHASMGILKKSNTQQILQRRPELELDLYPISGSQGQVVIYNIVQTPFKEEPNPYDDESSASGSIYTLGMAPVYVDRYEINGASFFIKAGVDGWTKFFAERQYRESETDKDFLLTDESGEPIEDTAQRYFTETMIGVGFNPAWWRSLQLNFGGYYDLDFKPKYNEDESYTYQRIERSFYRFRTQIDISSELRIINDFYQFYGGLFEESRDEDRRRYRNILRLAYAL